MEDDQHFDFNFEEETQFELEYQQSFCVKVVRHVNNVLILQSEQFTAELTLKDNIVRDVLCMALRQKIDKFSQEPDSVRSLGEKDFYKKKE